MDYILEQLIKMVTVNYGLSRWQTYRLKTKKNKSLNASYTYWHFNYVFSWH